jgi:hypothetical protein
VIIAVASRKASPGVTTLTALLAAYWHEPGASRLVVEADPSGGTLAARFSTAHRLSWDPGLLALSTSRSRLSGERLPSVAQEIEEGLWVAAAPPAPDQVSAGLARMGDQGAAQLAAAGDIRAFVDCGRLTAGSPAISLARRAALTILLCRPRLDEVHALAPAVTELNDAGCTLGLICVGDRPYTPTEVADTVGIELLGVLPVDDRAAAAFDADGLNAGRVLRRSALAATMAELAGLIGARVAATLAPAPAPAPARAPAPAPGRAVDPAPEPARAPAPAPVRTSKPAPATFTPPRIAARPPAPTHRPDWSPVPEAMPVAANPPADDGEVPVSLAVLAARQAKTEAEEQRSMGDDHE